MKVKLAGKTVPSVVSELVILKETFAVGWESRTAVNVSVPPASVVVKLEVGVIVIPAVSLSVIV